MNIQGEAGPRDHTRVGVACAQSDYFEIFRNRVVLGGTWAAREDRPPFRVAVVSEAFVRRVLSGGNPLGRHVGFGPAPANWFAIVGVVKDAKYKDLREKTVVPFVYVSSGGYWRSALRDNFGRAAAYVRTQEGPLKLARPIRALVEGALPGQITVNNM